MKIRPFDAICIPFKRTGKVIPTDLVPGNIVQKMCAFQRNEQKNIILMYTVIPDFMSTCAMIDIGALEIPDLKTSVKSTVIKCFDYTGKLLWKFSERKINGALFSSTNTCTDDSGHVFVADRLNPRIVVLTCGRSIQSVRTLMNTPGNDMSIEWCNVSRQLVALYNTDERSNTVAACYDVRAVTDAEKENCTKTEEQLKYKIP